MTTDQPAPEPAERFEVTRLVRAPAAAVFDVLTDPRGHVLIDSSGMLMSADGDRVTAPGDTFVVHMDREALGDLPIVSVGPDVLHEGLDLRRVSIAGLKGLLHLEKRPVMGRVALVGIPAKCPAVFLGTKAAWPRTVALVDVVDVDGWQTAHHGTRLPCGQIFPQHGPEFAAERTPCLHTAACQVIQHAQRGAVRHNRIGALALVRAPHLIYTFP